MGQTSECLQTCDRVYPTGLLQVSGQPDEPAPKRTAAEPQGVAAVCRRSTTDGSQESVGDIK